MCLPQPSERTEELQTQANTPMNPFDLLAETVFGKRTSSEKHHPAGLHFGSLRRGQAYWSKRSRVTFFDDVPSEATCTPPSQRAQGRLLSSATGFWTGFRTLFLGSTQRLFFSSRGSASLRTYLTHWFPKIETIAVCERESESRMYVAQLWPSACPCTLIVVPMRVLFPKKKESQCTICQSCNLKLPFPLNKKYFKHQWVGGGLLHCFRYGFGVGSEVGWAASCRHTHQKKSGATTLNGSAELKRLRALGGPKLAAPTVTHIERKLAPTISPVSAIMAILV